jgi:hypothetical protein
MQLTGQPEASEPKEGHWLFLFSLQPEGEMDPLGPPSIHDSSVLNQTNAASSL